ncbi:MAG: YibE/F family protein [Kiritimatiellae bacterium]|nr:YibE/F family protein [Kiritimatiellia bacterium]
MKFRRYIPVAVLAACCVALWLAPPVRPLADDSERNVRARVVAVDDGDLSLTGLLEYGTQHLEVELLDGPAAGRRFRAENEMRAQLDLDKKFKVGDVASVAWPASGAGKDDTLVARDHWRLGWMGALWAVFCLLLIAFGGWTGAKALFSFMFSCLVVWKMVIPLALSGWPASWICFAAVCVLTGVIMYLVAGATRKGLTAFLGSVLGVAAGLAAAHLFGRLMEINGATLPFVQALLYSGCENLDIPDVFVGAVILASSGAVMDLAMDIAAGVDEVARRNPSLPPRELLLSGLRIGRSVVGTMTTTLLLAYSGGYLTLLMVFAAQGTPVLDFLNSTLVSAEVVKTLVGSFSLVLVAPATALVGAKLLCRNLDIHRGIR